jgi:DNA-binding NarL/FixJ family response regulator
MGRSSPPLIGREEECRAITAAMAEEHANGLVITGPPGVGRTRLAREALEIAAAQGRRTRWAKGSKAAALVPLGALAHLLPPMDPSADPLSSLQHAARAITADGSGRPPVLGVDDVHLLDPLSVSLLHQLGAGGAVTLVLTVRTDPTTPDPVAPLWKDGLATRLELREMRRPDADRLASQVLDGQVDTRTGERLWHLTRGNPLFLCELLEDGRRAGRLHARGGVWRWKGPMAPSQRLSEIVLAQLGPLDPAEWAVLEVLAAREPLGVDRVAELSSAEAVAALARRGVIVDDVTGRTGEVRPAHPLYTEVVRRRVPAAALRDIRRQLADGQLLPTSHSELRHRSASMLDDVAGSRDADLLTEAARRANALLDHPLAEQLAEAGVEAGGGAPAQLALAEATQWQGDLVRSEKVAAEVASMPLSEEQFAQLTTIRAVSLGCGLGRTDEAFEVLDDGAMVVENENCRALVTATEACLAFLSGKPRRAVELATLVLDHATGNGIVRPLAAAAAAAGMAVMGRSDEALAAVTMGWADLERVQSGPELAFVRLALARAEVLALRYAGRVRHLERRAAELHVRNLAAPEWAGDAAIALYRGSAALASGQPRIAVRWMMEALARLDERDPMGLLPLCVAELATAKVLVGDVDSARAVLAESRMAGRRMPPVFRPTARLAEAWLQAGESRIDDAGALALEAAAEAAATEQWAVEAVMLHAAMRFGRGVDVLDRINSLADDLDSPLVAACAAHVQGMVSGDGDRLDEVSARFDAMGAVLLAADAAADAAAAHDRVGDRTAAAASRTAAAALARRCDLIRSPGSVHPALSPLTAREEEVAQLATRGLSNQAIATRLVVSVRTVETHLAHVYAKLGIRSRHRLVEVLAVRPDGAPTGDPAGDCRRQLPVGIG